MEGKLDTLVTFIVEKIKSDLKHQHSEKELRLSMEKNLTKREVKTVRKELTRRTEFLEDGKVLLINDVLILLDWFKSNQTHQTLILNYQVIE